MHDRDIFWKPFGRERVNESQKLLKSAEKYFYPTFSSFWAKLSLKKLFLIRFEILGLLVNKLTANYNNSGSNSDNLSWQIQIKYLKNHKLFCFLFFLVLEFTLNGQCSETNMSVRGQIFLELWTPKDVFIQMHNRDCFWKSFGSERVNKSQKIMKSAKKHFYPTFESFQAKFSLKNWFLIRFEILRLLVNTLTAN